MEKMNPLLSGSLKQVIKDIIENHEDCCIAKDLNRLDDLINCYNNFVATSWIKRPHEDVAFRLLQEEIDSLYTYEASMLTFRINDASLSFLPKGKPAIYNGETWSRENRQTAKPARLVQKILKNEYKCKECEDFANWIKNELLLSGDFKLVEGSDITKYYNEETYYKDNGTLGNSCMRYSDKYHFFDIYEDHAKMLVYLKDDKVMGRAIVWELPEGTFMDRVYTCEDYLFETFIEYAKDHKWYIREENSLLDDGEKQHWLGPNSGYHDEECLDLYIQLTKKYDRYPYIDSFRYLDVERNILSTDPNICDVPAYCSNTDGSYEHCETYICPVCGNHYTSYDGECPEDMVWCEYDECYACDDCAIWCEYGDFYFIKSNSYFEYNNEFNEDCVIPIKVAKEDTENFIEIDGKWYYKHDPNYTNDEGDFHLIFEL